MHADKHAARTRSLLTRKFRHSCKVWLCWGKDRSECRSLWLDRPSDVTPSWPVILQVLEPILELGSFVEGSFPQFVQTRRRRCSLLLP